jgi:hypothetical protein
MDADQAAQTRHRGTGLPGLSGSVDAAEDAEALVLADLIRARSTTDTRSRDHRTWGVRREQQRRDRM